MPPSAAGRRLEQISRTTDTFAAAPIRHRRSTMPDGRHEAVEAVALPQLRPHRWWLHPDMRLEQERRTIHCVTRFAPECGSTLRKAAADLSTFGTPRVPGFPC